jgi:hypothetical protein
VFFLGSMLIETGFELRITSSSHCPSGTCTFPPYFRRAAREMTVGISSFGAASPKALNCSGFRNITEPREQA